MPKAKPKRPQRRTHTISLRITPAMRDALRAEAAAQNRPQSNLIESLMLQALAHRMKGR